MKRIALISMLVLFLFCSCGKEDKENITADYIFKAEMSETQTVTDNVTTTKLKVENYVSSPGTAADETTAEATAATTASLQTPVQNENGTFVASWLSYMEISVKKGRDTEEAYSQYIESIFDNMKQVGVTDVFVQVRPFADAFYKSDLFPSSKYAAGEQGASMPFDVLSLITEIAAEKKINIHAWINPYRVTNETDINTLSKNNPAYKWYEEGNNERVVVAENGIYFNPSSPEVQKLIIDGAREIMQKYPVKGIHIDDYFYFDDCGDFDRESYKKYVSSGGQLTVDYWRRENVSTLVSSLYAAVKGYGEDKIFSVSPAGDMKKCYEESYADVFTWCRESGYCDMIIPQLYFGFENEKMPFDPVLTEWVNLCSGGKVKLTVGLALYKAGKEDTYALSGKNEWIENSDIISRQVQSVREKNCYGYALYSGSYIDFSENTLSEELNNLKNVAS